MRVGEDEEGSPWAPLVQPLWKTVCRVLKMLKIKPSCDPAIPLLSI